MANSRGTRNPWARDIVVNEYDTMAEAVTIHDHGSSYSYDKEYSDEAEFIVDHPFLYAIWDDAGISFCCYIAVREIQE